MAQPDSNSVSRSCAIVFTQRGSQQRWCQCDAAVQEEAANNCRAVHQVRTLQMIVESKTKNKKITNAPTVSAVMDSHYRLASSLNDIASYKYWLSCCLLEGKHILFFFQSSPVFSPVQCYGKFSWLDRFFKACNQVGVERTGSCFYGQDLTRASAVLKDTWHLEERRRSLRNDSVNRVTSLTPNKILMRLLNNVACTRWG